MARKAFEMKLQMRGLEALIKKVHKANVQKLPRLIEKSVDESAIFVASTLRANVPVDTGNLRRSIRVEKPSPFIAFIGPNLALAPYAPFVEFGHHTRSGSFVQGSHFLESTAVQTNLGVIAIFKRNLKTLF